MTTTNKAADKSLSFADRLAHVYAYAGQAGDLYQVATINALRAGKVISVREIDAIIDALEIPAKAFWSEAGGGDKVPMGLSEIESCVEAIET